MKRIAITLIVLLASCATFAQEWDIVSVLDDYEAEGWYIFQPPRTQADIAQNSDGTVTVTRLGADSSTIYLTHDVSWIEPDDLSVDVWAFTYEFRVRVDQIGGPNNGAPDDHGDRASIYPVKNQPGGEVDTYSNGRTWLCSFDKNEIGSRYFANENLPKAAVDFSEFHVITFVCELDYLLYDEKVINYPLINFGEAFEGDDWPERALGDHSPWTLYIDRNFDEPALVDMPGSG